MNDLDDFFAELLVGRKLLDRSKVQELISEVMKKKEN